MADDDYRFNGVWAKLKWNASKTCAVGVEWRTDRQLVLGFTVTAKGDETRWAPFLTSPIGLGKIDTAAGKLVWEDDRHAWLWHSNKRDGWRIDTETLQVHFLYAPAEEGNPHGQYQLGKMYLNGDDWVGVDPVKARHWLGKSADQGFARAKRLLEDL
ncbi:tetratricopeptide repeat protein [Caulobacter sp. RL271]|uniref:SEL1-like repeat protein n=1 Tax=Caulobacter segnis TaxID=88688 RepID=A0ABY4ZUT2_9CAUL|nr:SEL1-like repeat protein [Caulobacter segnis]USQ96572.1 SEL1-like repeat protein [Caulobacter segnis]